MCDHVWSKRNRTAVVSDKEERVHVHVLSFQTWNNILMINILQDKGEPANRTRTPDGKEGLSKY